MAAGPHAGDQEVRSRTRARLVLALKMAIGFALLGLVVVLNRDQIRQVLHHPLDWSRFVLGFGIYLVALVLAFVRWSFYVMALGVPFRIRDGVRLGFISNLFNFILPGGPVGGDIVRAAFLCRERASLKPQAIGSVVLDRLVGLLALMLLAIGGGMLAWRRLEPPVQRLVGVSWTVAAIVVLTLAVGFSPALYRPLARRFAHRPKLEKRLQDLVAMGTAYRQRLWVVGLGLAMAMLTHSMIVLAFYQASRAMFRDVPSLAEHFLIVPLVLVTTAVPLPFGALGLSEGVSGHFFSLVGYPAGAVAMMGFRVIQYSSAIPSTAVYLANFAQVKTLRAEAERMSAEAQLQSLSEVG